MNDRPNIRVGQVVRTADRQITIPDWHEKYNTASGGWERIADMPCIRLECGASHGRASDVQIAENWGINTDYIQYGLVCFVPERYLGMAVLSVSIVSVRGNSVIGQPIEWIELNPTLDVVRIGGDAQEVFDRYLDKVQEKLDGDKDFDEQDTSCLDYRAIWHNKDEYWNAERDDEEGL